LKKRISTKEKAKEKEDAHRTTTTTAMIDEGYNQELEQEEIDKNPYRRVLETPFLDFTAAAIAKNKLQLRWKSREEIDTTDDFSTILHWVFDSLL
jgi:hypothetical protein